MERKYYTLEIFSKTLYLNPKDDPGDGNGLWIDCNGMDRDEREFKSEQEIFDYLHDFCPGIFDGDRPGIEWRIIEHTYSRNIIKSNVKHGILDGLDCRGYANKENDTND